MQVTFTKTSYPAVKAAGHNVKPDGTVWSEREAQRDVIPTSNKRSRGSFYFMNIGEIVYCKHQFLIENYSVLDETLTITLLKNNKTIDRFRIPMYISDLGLYPPSIDYVIPGPHLPETDENYFQGSDTDNSSDYGYIVYKGRHYRISLDKDFAYTGKYYLVPTGDRGSLKVRYSRLRTQDERIELIKSMLHTVHEGNLINGRISYFVQRELNRTFIKLIEERGITEGARVFLETTNSLPIFAVIHDLHTNVEYEFNVLYLDTRTPWL